jgi:hypothetical protein
MLILQSIAFTAKSGWVTESIPMYKRQAEALYKVRLANNKGEHRRRYRLVKA